MRFSRLTLVIAAFAVPTALAAGSCGVILDTFEKVPAAADAGVDAAPDVDEGCKSVTYPPPPEAIPDDGDIDLAVAIRSINLGENATKDAPVGLDLDSICTCLGEGASCKYPSYALDQDHCDDKGGVDNASAKLMGVVSGFLTEKKFGSTFYSEKAEKGFWTLIARVSGYNGKPDDPKVTFALYSPQGLEQAPMDADGGAIMTCFEEADGGPPPPQIPCWHGSDVWGVASSSITPGGTIDDPLYVDKNAYVSGSILVANVSDATINLGGGVLNYMGIKLTAGTIMGTLVDPGDGLGWRVEKGTVAGRWRTADIFGSLGTFVAEGNKLCTSDPILYPIVKERVCEFVDISSKLGGATQECDAISFAMDFSAFPVRLGGIVPTVVPTSQCPPETDPSLDSCDKP